MEQGAITVPERRNEPEAMEAEKIAVVVEPDEGGAAFGAALRPQLPQPIAQRPARLFQKYARTPLACHNMENDTSRRECGHEAQGIYGTRGAGYADEVARRHGLILAYVNIQGNTE
jgi:hypothetical protein